MAEHMTISRPSPMNRYRTLPLVVGIAFAALTFGCASPPSIESIKTEPPPQRQEDQKEMQQMLYPSPNQ